MASFVNELALSDSFFVYRPHVLARTVEGFKKQASNMLVMYAVKTNDSPYILTDLHKHGISAFDVASLEEVKKTRQLLPNAALYFMHPVKSREAIRVSYFDYGVRSFSLDTSYELEKIVRETGGAKDLRLYVRVAVPNTHAKIALDGKFGADMQEAVLLLKEARKKASILGVCFHVGSQCVNPLSYRLAIEHVGNLLKAAGVRVDNVDVGGGFPVSYVNSQPPCMDEFFVAIKEAYQEHLGSHNMQILCEPGRALVAESESLIVQVQLRKGSHLYINDGTYGAMFDAGVPGFAFPVRMLRNAKTLSHRSASKHVTAFSFYGPTCDTSDYMCGPFYLPDDVQEGDYIEIGQMGAYGRVMSSQFNGFGHNLKRGDKVLCVPDEFVLS